MSAANPRLDLLRKDVEEKVLSPFRSHGWSAEIVHEVDHHDCIEIQANRNTVAVRIAVLYSSSGISNAAYWELSNRVQRIFFRGQAYELESFTRGVTVPVESLDGFFAFLVELNKQLEPDRSHTSIPRTPSKIRRLTAENPLDAVIARLRRFTSETLARKMVERRAVVENIALAPSVSESKAAGVAHSMRSGLDYVISTPRDPLNKRVLSLYYGVMAFAQAEMLASPTGPADLDTVEAMTRDGHGLYTLAASDGGFADLRVGVLARGFFPQWVNFLGQDTSGYPTKRPRSPDALRKVPTGTACLLSELFASIPEIDDLFAEVVGGPPGWISVAYDQSANVRRPVRNAAARSVDSTYGLFLDSSGKVSAENLESAGWPLAEVRRLEDHDYAGTVFRARVDHAGYDTMWPVLPTHSSPFGNSPALLFPTVGGLCEYRTIAAVTLYALSIIARYMPGTWQRVEGGDQDHYLALLQASMAVWERLVPEQFLQSITGETVRTVQPGSFFA